jgi:hypothetical protein
MVITIFIGGNNLFCKTCIILSLKNILISDYRNKKKGKFLGKIKNYSKSWVSKTCKNLFIYKFIIYILDFFWYEKKSNFKNLKPIESNKIVYWTILHKMCFTYLDVVFVILFYPSEKLK